VLATLRRRPSPATVRLFCVAALVANAGIVVSGAAVRLTASGLGCPTWPRCTDESLVATREMGLHGTIEFGNRMFTWLVLATAVACLVTTLRAAPRRPVLVRLSAVLIAGIAAQALIGGVTVLTGLNPLTVAAHFLVSMGLVAVATVLVERAGEADGPAVPVVRPQLLAAARLLVGLTATTLVLGTLVTGAGPHSGDVDATDRLPVDPATATQLHADAVFATLGVAVALLAGLHATGAPERARARLRVLLAVAMLQGLVGYTQYFTDLPVALVGVHVLGATLVWIAAVRVLLATRVRATVTAGRAETDPTVSVAT
jgi:heme a synthase